MTSNNNKTQHVTGSTNNTSNIGTQDPNRSLKNRVKDIFNRMSPPLTCECCIYRVPRRLRMINEAAYTPYVISIGPFHHNKDELKSMEKHKVRYLHRYIHTYKVSLDYLLTIIKNWEDRVRQCYGESIELNSDDFVMMVLLDSLFIIEYLKGFYYGDGVKDEDDKFLYHTNLARDIRGDLLLLENQLPFFILELLHNEMLFPHSGDPTNDQRKDSFLEISCQVYHNFNRRNIRTQLEVLHFTDLIRTFYIPSFSMVEESVASRSDIINERLQIPSAKELHEAGVRFKIISSDCLFGIRFNIDNKVLDIPQFEFEDNTESIYRNLMALEQFRYLDQTYMRDYIILMGTLIHTSRDVELLVRKRIILNTLGDHDVLATIFNKLGLEIRRDRKESYFYKINQDLFKYYMKPRHKWRAAMEQHYWMTLERDYCSSPWKIASVGAATILLLLTLLQTIISYKSS